MDKVNRYIKKSKDIIVNFRGEPYELTQFYFEDILTGMTFTTTELDNEFMNKLWKLYCVKHNLNINSELFSID